MLLLEAEVAVTSHCEGCYSPVASDLRRYVTKSLGIVLESFSFILSHTYLRLYSNLAKKERNCCLALSSMLIPKKMFSGDKIWSKNT